MIFTGPDNCSAKYSCLFAISDLKKPHKCPNLHDFGKFNINHINLILLVSLQTNAVCLNVAANKRIIQTNANIYTGEKPHAYKYCDKKFTESVYFPMPTGLSRTKV